MHKMFVIIIGHQMELIFAVTRQHIEQRESRSEAGKKTLIELILYAMTSGFLCCAALSAISMRLLFFVYGIFFLSFRFCKDTIFIQSPSEKCFYWQHISQSIWMRCTHFKWYVCNEILRGKLRRIIFDVRN